MIRTGFLAVNRRGGGGGGVTDGAYIIVAGQSNSRSYDTTGSDVPGSIPAGDADCMIWNTHTQAFEEYDPGVNSDTWNSGAATPQKWGPEAAFARDWRAANPGLTLRIVKIGVDSTKLNPDPGGDDWNPDSVGELFDDMTTEIAAAEAAIVLAGGTPDPIALLWMQGEHDALDNLQASNYGVELDDFFTAVRAEWGDAGTEIILGRISESESWTYGSTIRAFQGLKSRGVSGVYMVDTDDLPRAGDNKHYTAAGVETLGERMASALAGSYPEHPVVFERHSSKTNSQITLSNGNKTAAGTGTNSTLYLTSQSDLFVESGKIYFEVDIDAKIANMQVGIGANISAASYIGAGSSAAGYSGAGQVYSGGSAVQTYASWAAGDIIGVAYDATTRKVWFSKNGVWNGDPAAGTGEATTLSGTDLPRLAAVCRRSGDQATLKAASADWTYSAPSGFSEL